MICTSCQGSKVFAVMGKIQAMFHQLFKKNFLHVLFCLKERSGFMKIPFFSESSCWLLFFLLLSFDGRHFHGW